VGASTSRNPKGLHCLYGENFVLRNHKYKSGIYCHDVNTKCHLKPKIIQNSLQGYETRGHGETYASLSLYEKWSGGPCQASASETRYGVLCVSAIDNMTLNMPSDSYGQSVFGVYDARSYISRRYKKI
jgi:hypothetical protein